MASRGEGRSVETELRLRAAAVEAIVRRGPPSWGTRLSCKLSGHRWQHVWGTPWWAPVVCVRCGADSGSGDPVTLLGRHACR